MIAIGFLGYLNSPKWFYIHTFFIIIFFIILIFNIQKISKNKKLCIKNLKYNKVNYIVSYKNSFPLPIKGQDGSVRMYSTSIATNKTIVSDRLKDIIKELKLNPVYLFEDLNLEYTRKQILKDTTGLSGIYMIVNKITKDYYIGSASTNKFYSRFSNHTIYFRGSKIVKLAIIKYKIENFAFLILELYPNVVTKENNKELMDLEDKYLK